MTASQFWSNTAVRAILTALGAGVVAALSPLLPTFASGVMPSQAALYSAAMIGVGAVVSVLVSLLTRLVGDPNSGVFTK
jgi:hypothetical protein